MIILLLAIGITEMISMVLIALLAFLAFRLLEGSWSYRISKPFAWEEAARSGGIDKALVRIERSYRDKVRLYTLWLQTERLKRNKIAGAFAEVGVYQGETARMLHLMDPSRRFHLFDTFSGFDARDLATEKLHPSNQTITFSDARLDTVRSWIGGNEQLIFHPGYFPETAAGLDESFALVHLDADLYSPTLAALNYFYPRLVNGGVIIIHDYNHTWAGVRKAVDEFVPGIPESPVEAADWQGSVMIIRGS